MPGLLWGPNFVHEKGILCTKFLAVGVSVHEMGILCTKLLAAGDSVHERAILCTKFPAAGGYNPKKKLT